MRDAELRDLAAQEERHWWFRARRRILARVLDEVRWESAPRAVIDLGCGAGIDLERLPFADALRVGMDRDREPLRAARARAELRKSARTREGAVNDGVAREQAPRRCALTAGCAPHFVLGDGARLPLGGGRFDLGLALDVLEHVEDDAGALAEARRVLRPGGRLVVTAPACPWLWSEHDVALGHRRRYRHRDLLAKIEAAGFDVERETYFNALLFPLAATYRLMRRGWRGRAEAGAAARGEGSVGGSASLDAASAGQGPPGRDGSGGAVSDTRRIGNRGGWLLERVFGLESRWLARHRLPFGLSLLVVARRR
jgi:SAM-dependent methyltransferase